MTSDERNEYIVHAAVSYGAEQIARTITALEDSLSEARRYMATYSKEPSLRGKADEISFLVNFLGHNMQSRFRMDLLTKAYGLLVVASSKMEDAAP